MEVVTGMVRIAACCTVRVKVAIVWPSSRVVWMVGFRSRVVSRECRKRGDMDLLMSDKEGLSSEDVIGVGKGGREEAGRRVQ